MQKKTLESYFNNSFLGLIPAMEISNTMTLQKDKQCTHLRYYKEVNKHSITEDKKELFGSILSILESQNLNLKYIMN